MHAVNSGITFQSGGNYDASQPRTSREPSLCQKISVIGHSLPPEFRKYPTRSLTYSPSYPTASYFNPLRHRTLSFTKSLAM